MDCVMKEEAWHELPARSLRIGADESLRFPTREVVELSCKTNRQKHRIQYSDKQFKKSQISVLQSDSYHLATLRCSPPDLMCCWAPLKASQRRSIGIHPTRQSDRSDRQQEMNAVRCRSHSNTANELKIHTSKYRSPPTQVRVGLPYCWLIMFIIFAWMLRLVMEARCPPWNCCWQKNCIAIERTVKVALCTLYWLCVVTEVMFHVGWLNTSASTAFFGPLKNS